MTAPQTRQSDALPRLLRHWTAWGMLGLLLMVSAGVSEARIYACRANDGSMQFQDQRCPSIDQNTTASKETRQLPLGIHESWFDFPEHAEGRVFCDSRGCECGTLQRRHEDSVVQAVADALYLDGAWHRYQTRHQAWLDTPTRSEHHYERRADMLEAACLVMMSQQLLRDYADGVMAELRRRVLDAEERGFDRSSPCDAAVDQACEYYDSVMMYKQLVEDARALQRQRESMFTPTPLLPDVAQSD